MRVSVQKKKAGTIRSFWIASLLLTVAGSGPLGSEDVVSLSLENLAIPRSLGKIEDRFVGAEERWVIQIQDVHAHFAAQENIAALLDHLSAVYGIQTVALEGAWSATSFPKTRELPSSREKQMLARALLEADHITGPLYAALFTPTLLNLVGIEEEALYEENRLIYLKHLSERAETIQKLESLAARLAAEKEDGFSPELLSLDHALAAFREGRDAEGFLPALIPLAEARGIALEDLKELMLFKEAMAIEEAIDKTRLDSEASRLMEAFRRERLSFEELLMSGRIPAEKLQHYPHSRKYLELMKLQNQIRHRSFFEELEEAIRRLKEKIFVSEEERALDARSERFYRARKILLFEATPDDLAFLEGQRAEFESEMEAADLGAELALALSFYEAASRRNDIFFDKMTTDPRLAGNIAVVTGGFHTEALSLRLEEAGISYLVITPDLAGQAPDEKLYFERLSESPLESQTLSELRNRATDDFDEALARAVSKWASKEINDLRDAVSLVTQTRKIEAVRAPPPSQDFNLAAMDQTEQGAVVGDLRRMQDARSRTPEGPKRIFAVIKASRLQELLATPLGKTILEVEILSRRENTLILLQDTEEYLTETIGVRAEVRRIAGADIEGLLAQKKFQDAMEKKAIAVVDSDYENPRLLTLPVHPVSLLLIRPLLEYEDLRFATMDEEVFSVLARLLLDVYARAGLLRAA